MDHSHRNRFDRRHVAAFLALGLIAPAALFFLSAVGRSLQPINHEPARTLDQIAQAFLNLPPSVGVLLVVVAPTVALLMALTVVWRTVVTDTALTSDVAQLARAMVPLLRRPTLLVALLIIVAALSMTVFLLVHAVVG